MGFGQAMQAAGYDWPNGHEFDSARWITQSRVSCKFCNEHGDTISVRLCKPEELGGYYDALIDYNNRYMMAPDVKPEEEEIFLTLIRSSRRLLMADVLNKPEYEPGFWKNPGL